MSAKTEFNSKGKNTKREAPFSLRLGFEERAQLEASANGVPLGAYIKAILFEGELPEVRRRNTNPIKDQQSLGRVLSTLGQSRLSSNLNQMARAVNTGTLPVHPETEAELRQACADVSAMRAALLDALGKNGGAP